MDKRQNRILLLSFFAFVLFIFMTPVQAANECEGLLTVDAYNFLEEIITYVRILVPIILIVLGSIDFANAVISEDQDALKKSGSKFVKRVIAAIAIFFVPLVVKVLLTLPGIKDSIHIVDDPTCGL